jgi:hypothetical protein
MEFRVGFDFKAVFFVDQLDEPGDVGLFFSFRRRFPKGLSHQNPP